MTAKPKQRKRLAWYMVLATFVLLISFSTSPRAMNLEEIAASASASLRALEKPPLTTLHSQLVSTGSYKEWRHIIQYTPPHLLENAKAEFVRKILSNADGPMILHLIAIGKRVPKFKAAATLLENNIMSCSNKKLLAIVKFGKEVPSFQAATGNLERIILRESDEKVLSMIAAGKDDPVLKATAENLKSSLMSKWLLAGRNDEVFASIREGQGEWIQFLQYPLWSALIKDERYNSDVIYLTVLDMLEPHITGQELGRLIDGAKGIHGTRELANGLEKWWKAELTGFTAFKLLGLPQAKTDAMKSPNWNRWVSYLRKLAEKENPGGTPKEDAELVVLALQKHVTDNYVEKLTASGKTEAQTTEFANQLKRKYEPWLTLGNKKKRASENAMIPT